jgi:alcohol dehydrogenase class IV
VAEVAAEEHLNLTNPKPATADEFRAILDEAFG